MTNYVFGFIDKTPLLAVVTPTKQGWQCRSSMRGTMNHDYVSNEEFEDVHDNWLMHEMSPTYVAQDRNEAKQMIIYDLPLMSIYGNPELSEVDRAEQVLQHLEHGW